ncbi:methylenetetrahydrofolate reductase [NAD(P)H] [Hyphobacterium sp. HN65]|uniref:Methylenetetrahydrofolate reductase n=1 Tax=Hyphobacterium lacteum TaxID=3116575 RepID=A0ABU7LR03_9PROT|nr:methylenetetrahydrofolate reductase [NAD(P)H] [Hyphobacterium sp. HN65]MEE2526345.1 methylenetetrahydrofolate reductase [NAD(P)H] [Hyphobacterium sp. HN65]
MTHQPSSFAFGRNSAPNVSFEFFPPKTDAMADRLWDTVTKLEPYKPDFVSVTYGAGGSTRERTRNTVKRIISETRLNAAAHLTCVGATRLETRNIIRDYKSAGVDHIVALRGDSPEGAGQPYSTHPGGFESTAELVRAIREEGISEVTVGCYPERHPDSPSIDHDLDVLKAKIDAGATRAVTQFFFDPDIFFRFRDKAVAAGVSVPIIPGLMLQSNFNGLQRMADLCGASVPDSLPPLYEGLDDDADTRDLVTANVVAKLARKLEKGGADHFHFYTLNRANLAICLVRLLGVRALQKAA